MKKRLSTQGIRPYFSEDNLSRMLKLMMPKRIKRGETLFREGETADCWYYVIEGVIKLTKTSNDGNTITLSMQFTGDLIGHADSLPKSEHPFTAEALEDCELGVIRRDDLESLLRENGDLAVEFMRWIGMSQWMLQTKLRDMLLFGKNGALCSLLIRLHNSFGEPFGNNGGIRISVKLSNHELAEMIGATRESVNRMLSEMKKQGTIDLVNGHLVIKDLAYLRHVCSCENCPDDVCRM